MIVSSALLALSLTVCGPMGCKVKTTGVNMSSQECTQHMFRTIAAFQSSGAHVSRSLRRAECIDQPKGVIFKFAD